MNWLVISIAGYFLVAWEVILDKFMLSSRRISHPAVFAFYSGLLSFSTLLIFLPFGFHFIGKVDVFWHLLAGALFIYGILALFFAFQDHEASRVMSVVGAVIPLVTYFISLIFLEEKLAFYQIFGVLLLIGGGLLISFDFNGKKRIFAGFWHSILAGILMAIAFSFFKSFYEKDEFINVFIWTRLGLFSGALSLLALPSFRKKIVSSILGFREDKKKNYSTSGLFIFNKALGGIGSITTNYAISLGSVTVVNALISVKYVFVFVFSLIFSHWFHSIFQEKRNFGDVMQKLIAILVIGAGVVMVTIK